MKSLLILVAIVAAVHGHGRLMKPPSRSSIWRLPEFQNQNPPANYDDNQLYCGGIHQADDPGSNCGVCGDPASQGRPRDNEIGGKWERGIITARYTAGQVIDVEVDLTTAHKGNMEWRLCTDPSQETQECFNRNVLQLADGSGSKLAAGNTGMHFARLKLPQGVTCSRCVIQVS